MSRSGQISLTASTPSRSVVAAALAQAAQDIAPAARDAIAFFGQGVVSFITQPVDEALELYEEEIERRGVEEVFSIMAQPDFEWRAETLRVQTLQQSAEMGAMPPVELVQKPLVVTAETLAIQEDALLRIEQAQKAGGGASVQFDDLGERMRTEQEATERAFRAACLAAGTHRTSEPLFTAVTDFLTLERPNRALLLPEIEDARDTIHGQIRDQATEAWTALALAAGQEALKLAAFEDLELDVAKGKAEAKDSSYDGGRIRVTVSADDGRIDYELTGYKGEDCAGAEQRFVTALANVLGVDIGPKNLRTLRTVSAPSSQPVPDRQSAAEKAERERQATGRPRQRE